MNSPTSSPPTCCLVVLTDSLYLPGTKRAIESFFRLNPPIPVIAISDDPEALDDAYLQTRCQGRVLLDGRDYETLPHYKKRRSKRHSRTFLKFEAFADFGYERNIFLDSDILCLRPVPALFELRDSPILAAKDSGFRPTRGYKGWDHEINSGVLAIDRELLGASTIEQLKSIARATPGRGGYNAGDQGIVNKWLRAQGLAPSLLDQDYNLIKKDYTDESGLATCRLLHFAGRKPWFEGREEAPELSPLERLWHAAPSV